MKKILTIVAALCVAFNVFAQETRSAAESSLMGLGMPGPLATEVAGLSTGLGVISNNTYLRFRNNANSANLDVLRADTTDAIRLNANATLNFAIGGTAIMKVTSAGFLPATDGDNATANLGSSTAGFKNFYMTDATNDASMIVSNGLYINYPTGQSLIFREGSTSKWTMTATSGDLAASSSGTTVALQEATAGAACMGSLTCNGASDVVTSTTCATTGSRIFLTRTSLDADTTGDYYVKSISNGTSFTVACETNDTGTLNWIIFHEAA